MNTNITEELKNSLMEVYNKWKNKYDIIDDDVFFSDGEYDPKFTIVLEHICVYEEED